MTVNIEYLAGNLNDFIQREAKNITEDQLKAEYQRRLDGGDFKLPDELKNDSATTPADSSAAPATDAPAAAATDKTTDSDAKPATETAAEPPMAEDKNGTSGRDQTCGN